MDIVQGIVASANTRVLKEPRGFMKILQFIFTICAFATTTSFSSNMKVSVQCTSDKPAESQIVPIPLDYNFQLYKLDLDVCEHSKLSLQQDFSSDSGFFVAVGVLAFLFVIGDLVLYTVYDKMYNEDIRIPTFDFAIHIVFGILFLAASSAWANSLNGLKAATSLETIRAENAKICQFDCKITEEPDFAKLNISIILGFLNLFLFTSNLWFIYKETSFFASKVDQSQPQEPQSKI
ncbi:Synaptophysin [Armadillidium nasatum]|uniref:Synaptophysin n=1 Tax=Armadillidium nasatum TaxID=96803 RepID=A0A5N5SQU8_9CRUS|nr:Synaptophysin [Armadillidium nasatum]